jgi:hypothetical protein
MQTIRQLAIKQPSKTLNKLVDKCVSQFGKLNTTVNAALEQGRKEGFEDRQVGDMIRRKLLAAGYSRMTVSRALPASAKNKPRGKQLAISVSNKMLQNSADSSPLISNKMLQNQALQAAKTIAKKEHGELKLTQPFEFTASINHMGKNKVIWIRKELHPQIERFEGKQLRIQMIDQ